MARPQRSRHVNIQRLTAGKTRKTVLALTGVAASAGVALLVGPLGEASAASQSDTPILVSFQMAVARGAEPTSNEVFNSGWGSAWTECQKFVPGTHSAHLGTYKVEKRQSNPIRPEFELVDIISGWNCSPVG